MSAMEHPLITYRRGAELSQADLATALGVKPPAVCKWEQGRVPAERVLEVERITGISRHVLRPDIYGPASEAAPQPEQAEP